MSVAWWPRKRGFTSSGCRSSSERTRHSSTGWIETPASSPPGSPLRERKPKQRRCDSVRGDQALESRLEGDWPQELGQLVGVPVQDLLSYRLEVGASRSAAAISSRI